MHVPPGQRIRYLAPEPPEEDLAEKLRAACELADVARELKRFARMRPRATSPTRAPRAR